MTLIRRIPRIAWKHKARYLGLILLVTLGSLALITLNLLAGTLQHSFDRLGQEGLVEDARAWLVSEPDDLASLEQTYPVEIERRMAFDAVFANGITLRVFDHSERVDIPVVLNGRDLAADDEILLNPAFAAEQSLEIGGSLTLSGRSWRICGFFSLPDYIYPTKQETDLMTDPRHFGIAIISKNAMRSILDSSDGQSLAVESSLAIRYLQDPGNIKAALTEKYGVARWLDRNDNARITMVKAEVRGIREMTNTLPLAIFVINCALLAAILWRMIRLEFPHIGTLRALGISRSEILRHYLILPLAVAVIGAFLGTLGGLILTRPILRYYAAFFNLPVDRTEIDPVLMLASVLIPIILLAATACIVILRALRLTPLILIRGYKRKPKAMRLEKHIRFHKARFGTKFRIRHMVRSGGKLFIAMIGVTFATILLLLGFMVQDSYNFLMNEGIRQTFKYSQNYVFKAVQTNNPYGGEPYQLLATKDSVKNEAVIIQGLSEKGHLLQLTDKQGQPIDLESAAVSRVLADKLNLSVGDTLSLISNLDGKTYSLKIGAIAEVYILNSVYLPLADFNRLFNLPAGSFNGIYSSSELPIPPKDLYLTEKMAEVLTSYESYAGMLKMAMLGLGLASSLMALLILYILIALMIEENRRSIALLKILGYEPGEIRQLILRTFDIPVLAGFILGIPLLFNLYGRIIDSSFQEIDMILPLRLSPWYMAAGFALLYSTYRLTRHFSSRKIFRISMADELKTMQE